MAHLKREEVYDAGDTNLGSICGGHDEDIIVRASCHSVELQQKLGFESPHGFVFAFATTTQNGIHFVQKYHRWLHLPGQKEQSAHLTIVGGRSGVGANIFMTKL